MATKSALTPGQRAAISGNQGARNAAHLARAQFIKDSRQHRPTVKTTTPQSSSPYPQK